MARKTNEPQITEAASEAVAQDTATAASNQPDTKSAYRVTERAPQYVAGQRVKTDDILHLTNDQAMFELHSGHIVAADEAASNDL